MDNKERKIQTEVEKTLMSLDNRERLQPNPWLMTRIEERLKKESQGARKPAWSFSRVLQPTFMVLLLLLNVYTAYTVFSTESWSETDESNDISISDDFAYMDIDEQTLEYYIPE